MLSVWNWKSINIRPGARCYLFGVWPACESDTTGPSTPSPPSTHNGLHTCHNSRFFIGGANFQRPSPRANYVNISFVPLANNVTQKPPRGLVNQAWIGRVTTRPVTWQGYLCATPGPLHVIPAFTDSSPVLPSGYRLLPPPLPWNQGWPNVGPVFSTLAQHRAFLGPTSVIWAGAVLSGIYYH